VSGVPTAFQAGTIDALLRAEIDSNRRLLGLADRALRCIEGIGDSRLREIETYREQFRDTSAMRRLGHG
jgi:hypothetical protein